MSPLKRRNGPGRGWAIPASIVIARLANTAKGSMDPGRSLDILERQIRKLGGLVDDLLDVARITLFASGP